MSLLAKIKTQVVLDVTGLGLLSFAAGMWQLAAGVAAAGVSCLLMSLRIDKGR